MNEDEKISSPTWQNDKEVSFKKGIEYLNIIKSALELQLENKKQELIRLTNLKNGK